MVSCGSNKRVLVSDLVPGPKALIYKTRANYFDKVPISLSDDKTAVTSYPDPSDLKIGDKLLLPSHLTKGYLLDNRGISPNVAFLKYSYEEYAALTRPPDAKELMQSILDPDPIIELWDCGQRSDFTQLKELKQIIRKKFQNCKKLK